MARAATKSRNQAAVKFTTDPWAYETIQQIVDRAMAYSDDHGLRLDRMSITMDISATHSNGCPLRLEKFLSFDDFNFAHDLFGIIRHLDRDTGKLGQFFRPRCSAPDAA